MAVDASRLGQRFSRQQFLVMTLAIMETDRSNLKTLLTGNGKNGGRVQTAAQQNDGGRRNTTSPPPRAGG